MIDYEILAKIKMEKSRADIIVLIWIVSVLSKAGKEYFTSGSKEQHRKTISYSRFGTDHSENSLL